MSDGAPKRLEHDGVDVDADRVLYTINAIMDCAGHVVALFANYDSLTGNDIESCRDHNVVVLHGADALSACNHNINLSGVRHGITSFRRRGYASKTGGAPAGSWS